MTDQHSHQKHGRDHHDKEPHGKLDHAIDTARDAAGKAAQQTAATLESNPVGVLVGGLALGALVAAVLPRSDREKELLAPLGKRIATGAAAAFAAAKDAGRAELDQAGLSRSAASDRVHSLFEQVAKAAQSAGSAAVSAGRDAARTQ